MHCYEKTYMEFKGKNYQEGYKKMYKKSLAINP
jgi:hypothetical protein